MAGRILTEVTAKVEPMTGRTFTEVTAKVDPARDDRSTEPASRAPRVICGEVTRRP
jgi:hypothetical protein